MADPVPLQQPATPTGSAPQERPLGLSSSFVYAVTFITQLVGYISSFEIARHIASNNAGLALVGFVQFNLLLASSINTLGELRLGSAFVYYVARNPSKTQLTGTYFAFRAGFVVAFGIALLAFAPFISIVSPSSVLNFPSSTLFLSLAVFMLLPLLWTPGVVYNQLYVGLGNSIRGQLPTLVESVVRTSALVVVALTFPTANGPSGAVNSHALWGLTGGYVLGAAASSAIAIPAVWKNFARPRLAEFRHLLSYSWPLLGSLGLSYLVTSAMPILTRFFYDTRAVAIFNAANGFRVLLLALPAAVVVPLFPHLAGLHERKEIELLRDRIWRALRYTGMMVVPGAVLFVVYRVNLLLILFSKTFLTPLPGAGGGALPLAILAVSAIPLALTQIISTALNSIGFQRLELYITSTQVVVLFVGIFAFLPHGVLGFTGLAAIAFAALISSIAALSLNAYFLYTNLSVPFRWRPIWTIPLAAVGEFLVLSRLNALASVNAYFYVNRWYQLLAVGALAIVVYVAILIATGELSRQDVRIFVRALGLPERWANALARICWREISDPDLAPTNGPPPPRVT